MVHIQELFGLTVRLSLFPGIKVEQKEKDAMDINQHRLNFGEASVTVMLTYFVIPLNSRNGLGGKSHPPHYG